LNSIAALRSKRWPALIEQSRCWLLSITSYRLLRLALRNFMSHHWSWPSWQGWSWPSVITNEELNFVDYH
jgi:hypothetical protein